LVGEREVRKISSPTKLGGKIEVLAAPLQGELSEGLRGYVR